MTNATPDTAAARTAGAETAVTPIRRALLSVSDKSGLEPLAAALVAHGAELVSTGGTAAALRALGHAVTEVAALTGAPEMLDGRVKTLHPAVHGGLLAKRDDPEHQATMAERGLAPIDLVVVNLYPFAATVASGADAATAIEQIDIGGPAMIRSAAKNHADVAVLTDPADYPELIEALAQGGAALTLRRRLAAKAYARTAAYDAAVAAWFAAQAGEPFPERLTVAAERALTPSYGENPHQRAGFYLLRGEGAAPGALRPGVATAASIQGKPLSYNNIADADAAFELVSELSRFGSPATVIVKHANPCGAALGDDLAQAYRRARAADPVSAFGGVIAVNRPLDGAAAAAMLEIFTEVVIAPNVSEEARALFAAKPNLRLLETGGLADPAAPARRLVSVGGGLLAQDRDALMVAEDDLEIVTKRAPTRDELRDLLFAWTVAKHVKSNAIVFAQNAATAGVGAGQMSRIDSTRIAARKAEDASSDLVAARIEGSAVASDAFFPFADGLLAAAEAGASTAIQPGGSIRDDEVIAAADEAGLAMVFTGKRHFRH